VDLLDRPGPQAPAGQGALLESEPLGAGGGLRAYSDAAAVADTGDAQPVHVAAHRQRDRVHRNARAQQDFQRLVVVPAHRQSWVHVHQQQPPVVQAGPDLGAHRFGERELGAVPLVAQPGRHRGLHEQVVGAVDAPCPPIAVVYYSGLRMVGEVADLVRAPSGRQLASAAAQEHAAPQRLVRVQAPELVQLVGIDRTHQRLIGVGGA
jgi:hypothetical protein